MAATPLAALRARAEAVAETSGAEVTDCASVAGGGSLPGREIPSAGVRLAGDRTAALRRFDPPVVARAHDGATICDLRTVDPSDDAVLVKAIAVVSA
jgi:L-seryl-tRNA(Ser) seleniumtransferase